MNGDELTDLVVDPTEKDNQGDNPQFLTIHTEMQGELDKWKKRFSGDAVASPNAGPRKKKKK